MRIVDAFNRVGNEFAVSSDGIATALQGSASALASANNDMESSIALVAAANRVVQDESEVGAALRTISLRLRGTSVSELEELGESTEGAVESVSKLQSKLLGLTGVNILNDDNSYKSTYEILLAISEVYSTLDDQSKAATLELIAGKNRSNVASALLTNTKDLKAAYEAASSSSGSAAKELDTYLSSIQGKIDQFNNAVQSMWSNTLDSGVIKAIVDFATGLIKIVDKFGLINTLVFGIMTYLSVLKKDKLDFASILGVHDIDKGWFNKKKDKTSTPVKDALIPDKQAEIDEVNKDIDDIANAAEAKIDQAQANLKDGTDATSQSQYLGIFQNGLSQGAEKLTYDTKQLGVELDKLNNMDNAGIINYMTSLDDLGDVGDDTKRVLSGYASTVKDGNYTVQGAQQYVNQYNQNLEQTSISATKARLAQAGLNLAISLATAALTALIIRLVELATNAQKKFDKLSSQLSKTGSELKDINSQLDETKKRIEELQEQGVLTFTDREELDRLRAQNEELERQKQLTESIQKQQQKGVNESAIDAANQYKKTGRNSGKTDGEKIGNGALIGVGVGGAAAGVALSTAGGAAALGTALTTAGLVNGWNPVGWGLLAAGAIVAIGAAIGAGIGALAAAETNVGQSMENMREEHEKLQEKYEKKRQKFAEKGGSGRRKRMENASEELAEYESMMAEQFAEMDQYYSSIDLSVYDAVKDADTIERLRNEMNEFYDTRDKWLIQSGAVNAKSNAISRIFGENASQELQDIKKEIQDAMKAGEEFDFSGAFDEDFKQRLYAIGLTVADIKYYFHELKKAEDEAAEFSTEDAVRAMANLTSKVENLKGAFDEFNETGIVTAKTLVSLSETFGNMGDKWTEFVRIMTSGTSSTEEAKQAINELIETLITSALSGEAIGTEQYVALWAQLTNLGVTNATEILDGIKEYSSIGEQIASDVVNSEKTIEQAIADYERANNVLLTAEQKSVVRATYDAKIAKQKADTYQTQSDTLSTLASEYERAIEAEKEWENEVEKAEDTKSGRFLGFLWKVQNATDKERETSAVLNEETAQKNREAIEKQIESLYSQVFGDDGAATDTDAKILELQTFFAEPQNYDELSAEAQAALDELGDKLGLNVELEFEDFDAVADKVQDVYSTLKDITTEYNTHGYLSLDNLQALLNLQPEYLAMLQMEGGQLTINQSALQSMIETKLDDAEATAVQTAITQLNALAERKKAIEVSNSAVATNQASIELGTYSGALSTVAQDAIVAAGSVAAFNAALKGAQNNEFVSDEEWQQVLDNYQNTVGLISSVRENLASSFNSVLDPGSNTAEGEVNDDRFQKEMDYWENRISANQAKYEQLQNEIDLLEAKGQKADTSFYEEQIELEKEREWLLGEQKKAAETHLATLEEGSEEWWEVANTLNDIEGELDDVTSSILDLQDAIGEIDTYRFEEFNTRLDNLVSKLETIRNLMAPNDEEDWFDDEGNWTEAGVAVLGSQLQQLEIYKQGYKDTVDELAKYESPYAGNESYYESLGIHSEQEYYCGLYLNQQYVLCGNA